MNAKINLHSIDSMFVDQFHQGLGEAFINTLNGGGGYAFLLDRSLEIPVLIIDVLNYKLGLNVKLIVDNKEYNFYSENLDNIIKTFKLKKIYVNHIIWANGFSKLIDEIIKSCRDIELNIYIHDFFTLCPTINLLNYKGQYCAVPSYNECMECISEYRESASSTNVAKRHITLYNGNLKGDIRNWRNLWRKIFDQAKYIITPSQSTADIFNKAYDNQYKVKIIVKGHLLKDKDKILPKNIGIKHSFLNVYLLGYLDEHKGSNILKSLIDMTAKQRLNICYHVLGQFEYNNFINSPFLKLHGTYRNDQLADLLNSLEIDMFIQPSICPETFSYVIHEMKMTKLPILAFNIGAQAEFLSNYEFGKLINEISPEAMFSEIKLIYDEYIRSLYPILQNNFSNYEVNELVNLLQEKYLKIQEQNCLIKALKNQLNPHENKLYEIDQLRIKVHELEQLYTTLINSTSWKWTKPLRKLGVLVKKLQLFKAHG